MNEIIEKIKEVLIEKCKPEAIILFGSYARGTQNNESDIDIAIKTNQKMSKLDIFNLKNELEEISKKDIDLINLDMINSDGFKYEILVNGIEIYCEDKYKFDLYKLDMYREYLELNESRQEIINMIKEGDEPYGKSSSNN